MITVKMNCGTKYELKNVEWSKLGISAQYRVLPSGVWLKHNGLFPHKQGSEEINRNHAERKPWYFVEYKEK